MIIFGTPSFGLWNDAPALTLGSTPTWSVISPGVSEPVFPEQVYKSTEDTDRKQMVAYGGNDGGNGRTGLLYQFTTGPPLWTYLSPLVPGVQPPLLTGFSIVYVPYPYYSLILYGGHNDALNQMSADVWTGDLRSTPIDWRLHSEITPPAVLKRRDHSAIWDPTGGPFGDGQMVIYGGLDATNSVQADVWAINPFVEHVWRMLSAATDGPGPSYGHTAVYEPVLQSMVLYGGGLGARTWLMSRTDPVVWQIASVVGGPPPARVLHTAVYDDNRERMLVFGGGVAPSEFVNDLWSLDFHSGLPYTWTQVAAGGWAPSPRELHTAVFDKTRDAMTVFGGFSGEYNADVSLLTFAYPLDVPIASQRMQKRRSITVSPNPAAGTVSFGMVLDSAVGRRALKVLDVSGREVWSTAIGPGSGPIRVQWDGRCKDGSRARPGIYVVRIEGPGGAVGKCVVLR